MNTLTRFADATSAKRHLNNGLYLCSMSVVKPIPLVALKYLNPGLRTYVGKEYGALTGQHI